MQSIMRIIMSTLCIVFICIAASEESSYDTAISEDTLVEPMTSEMETDATAQKKSFFRKLQHHINKEKSAKKKVKVHLAKKAKRMKKKTVQRHQETRSQALEKGRQKVCGQEGRQEGRQVCREKGREEVCRQIWREVSGEEKDDGNAWQEERIPQVCR
jgi:hypothetical protein